MKKSTKGALAAGSAAFLLVGGAGSLAYWTDNGDVTGTTLNVPSLMGAIMAVGVASANSILLVTFAREQQLAGVPARRAAVDAGHTRIRPVLMTAAAMIVGMIPMAIGGPGEEQNAALARAVIGGLLFATPTTLLVVPYLFALLRKGNDGKTEHGVFEGGV